MRKSIATFVGMSLISAPVFGQTRPEDCRPVFPIMDDVAALPQDVIAEPIAPLAAARRGFFGLPFLLPLLAAVGGIGALALDDDGDGDNDPVSPA